MFVIAGGFGHTSDGNTRGMHLQGHDNMSENSSQPPPLMRSKSRTDMSGASSRYQNLSYWKARRLIFYRNGDPFFPGVEYRFKPGRDVNSLETLLDKISPKMDLPRGARYGDYLKLKQKIELNKKNEMVHSF